MKYLKYLTITMVLLIFSCEELEEALGINLDDVDCVAIAADFGTAAEAYGSEATVVNCEAIKTAVTDLMADTCDTSGLGALTAVAGLPGDLDFYGEALDCNALLDAMNSIYGTWVGVSLCFYENQDCSGACTEIPYFDDDFALTFFDDMTMGEIDCNCEDENGDDIENCDPDVIDEVNCTVNGGQWDVEVYGDFTFDGNEVVFTGYAGIDVPPNLTLDYSLTDNTLSLDLPFDGECNCEDEYGNEIDGCDWDADSTSCTGEWNPGSCINIELAYETVSGG